MLISDKSTRYVAFLVNSPSGKRIWNIPFVGEEGIYRRVPAPFKLATLFYIGEVTSVSPCNLVSGRAEIALTPRNLEEHKEEGGTGQAAQPFCTIFSQMACSSEFNRWKGRTVNETRWHKCHILLANEARIQSYRNYSCLWIFFRVNETASETKWS